jgi:hypothetical protein
MLTIAALSTGKECHYEYQGTLMTAISDEAGRLLLQNWYDDRGELERQQFSNGAVYSYHYKRSRSGNYYEQADVTTPDLTVKTIPVADAISVFEKK